MEAHDSVVISRVVRLDDARHGRHASFITRIRALVREAKLAQPELMAYHLQEIGLQPRDGQVKLNLYFRR